MKQDLEKISAEKFIQLENELVVYKKIMGDATQIILDQDVSDFPLFIAHQQTFEMGILIAERGKVKGNWNIHASTLEEMVSKSVIEEHNIDEFKKVYKDPLHHFCVFVLSELGAQFVFLKR